MDLVWNIARKELLESIRDKRTLFLSIFLPILMYPAILLLGLQLATVQTTQLEEETSHVVVHGAPFTHPLVESLQADENLAIELREGPIDIEAATRVLANDDAQAVLDLTNWPADAELGGALDDRPAVDAYFAVVEPASEKAIERIEAVFLSWSEQDVQRRLQQMELTSAIYEPVAWHANDTNTETERGGYLLAAFLPFFILSNVVAGALYPAIDATAGERERKTIQTLFTAPVSTFEILLGKYLGVTAIALIAGLANLVSITLVVMQGLATVPDLAEMLDVSLTLTQVAGVAVAIVFVASMVAAMALAVAALAPTFKDASAFASTFFLVLLLPAVYAQMPGVELTVSHALIPALGQVLLMKEILSTGVELESVFLVGCSSVAWSVLAALFSARLFADERMLTGTGNAFRLLTGRKQLSRRDYPGTDDALAWFGIMFVGMYYIGATVQAWDPQVGLIITLWLLVGGTTVWTSWRLKLNPVTTFSLRKPSAGSVIGVVLMGVSGAVAVSALVGVVDQYLFPLPDEMRVQMQEALLEFFPRPTTFLGWTWLFILGAVSPAICEELLFRGFVLSGLRQSMKPWAAVLLTALLFGILHLSLFRLVGTTALGAIMGWLVIRTGSIFPAMIFHALNNAIALTIGFTMADAEPQLWQLALAGGVFVAGVVVVHRSSGSAGETNALP
jgi:sodium transport system permease protein